MLMLSALTGRAVLACGVCREPVSRSDLALFSPPQAREARVPVLLAHKACTSSQVCALLMPTYRSITVATMLDQLMCDVA